MSPTVAPLKHWDGLNREMVYAPRLEVFKGCVDVALRDMA